MARKQPEKQTDSRRLVFWELDARRKGVGTPYLDRGTVLSPLGRKTPKKLYEKHPLSQGFRAESQIPRHLVG
jgi:hypothetical protein